MQSLAEHSNNQFSKLTQLLYSNTKQTPLIPKFKSKIKAFKVVLGFSFLNLGTKPAHFSHICSKKQKTVFNTKYNYAHFFFALCSSFAFFVNSWTKFLYLKNFKTSKLSYTERSVKIQICILATLLTFAIFESFNSFFNCSNFK